MPDLACLPDRQCGTCARGKSGRSVVGPCLYPSSRGIDMPRRQAIPTYRLHKPSGQARVIIDGRHVYLGPHGSDDSKVEYERRVRKLLTDRQAAEMEAKVRVSNDLTVAELAAAYLKFARGYYVKRGRPTPE